MASTDRVAGPARPTSITAVPAETACPSAAGRPSPCPVPSTRGMRCTPGSVGCRCNSCSSRHGPMPKPDTRSPRWLRATGPEPQRRIRCSACRAPMPGSRSSRREVGPRLRGSGGRAPGWLLVSPSWRARACDPSTRVELPRRWFASVRRLEVGCARAISHHTGARGNRSRCPTATSMCGNCPPTGREWQPWWRSDSSSDPRRPVTIDSRSAPGTGRSRR